MAFDVEAAKADGYTDEEIQQYLASKGQPLPAEKPIDRGSEYGGMLQAALPTALELGAGAYGLKKVADMFRGAPAPTPVQAGSPAASLGQLVGNPSQVAIPGAAPAPAVNPMAQQAMAQQAQAAQAAANPTAGNYIERMSNLARQYGPAAARVGAGAGFGLYSGGLNTNEAEELRRRRMMPPTLTP